jgi:hypothetical protein
VFALLAAGTAGDISEEEYAIVTDFAPYHLTWEKFKVKYGK